MPKKQRISASQERTFAVPRGRRDREASNTRRRKLWLEHMEERRVLDGAFGQQFQVSPAQSLEESPPAVAIVIENGLESETASIDIPDKPFLISAWQTWEEDGSGFGIFVRAFDAAGKPISEPLPVNLDWLGNQQAPTIATDGQGNFLIAWQTEKESGGYDVVFRSGRLAMVDDTLTLVLDDRETILGEGTSPKAAMTRGGHSVIAWTTHSTLTGYDIEASVITSDGIVSASVASQPGDQLSPSIAADKSGHFVIAWTGPAGIVVAVDEDEEETAVAVFGRVITLSKGGSPTLTQEFLLSDTTYHDVTSPSAALSDQGRIAVAWQVEGQRASGSDIFMTVFGSPADALAAKPLIRDQRVNDTTMRPQRAPSIGLDKQGDALVTWQSQNQDGYSWGIIAKHYEINVKGKSGSPPVITATPEFLINETFRGPETLPAVSMMRSGRAVVGWLGPEVPNYCHAVEEGEGGHEPAVFVRWTDYGPSSGNAKSYGVLGSEMLLTNYVGLEDEGTSAAMDDRGISIVAWKSWQETDDTSSHGIYATLIIPDSPNRNHAMGRINNMALGNQSAPDVAVGRSQGGISPFVIVWQSDQSVWDDSPESPQLGYGIYAMLGAFDEDGQVGDPLFLTITQTDGDEVAPAVAMDQLGNFVVVWQASDGDGQGIFARHYDNEGTPIDDSFVVNQVIDYDQVSPTVSMNQSGQFVVAWVSDHNVMNDLDDTEKSIFASWFNDAQTDPPEEFLVNAYTNDAQEHPDVAIDDAGNFILVWQSINQEVPKIEDEPPVVPGVSWGIYARRFLIVPTGADEILVSPRDLSEFVVNDTFERPQRFASVGMDYDGKFVIAWQTMGQDGSSWGIYAKDYPSDYDPEMDPALAPKEFRLNSHTMGPQILPVVARSNLSNASKLYGIYWSGQGPAHTEGVFGLLNTSEASPYLRDSETIDLLFGLSDDEWMDDSFKWLEGSLIDAGQDGLRKRLI